MMDIRFLVKNARLRLNNKHIICKCVYNMN
jgi:hypothetical protein